MSTQSEKDARRAKRKAHFDKNSDPAQWRGRSVRFIDRKKRANKEKCRKPDEQEQ